MSRILIVEDDVWLGDCMAHWLLKDGHEVARAYDAQSALDALDGALPDLIILDMMLPLANGVQVLHQLPSFADTADIPVIVCSSAVTDGIHELSIYGVKVVLDKTAMAPGALRNTVKQTLAHATI